ncbi:hypothetical protein EW026_g5646 [Hermanssonia centrifuga]|uniref:Uncharacterized protein n=1 Tax=Hermanssonia centrifuga TaxID=98765 RepID=A0A4S4KHW0_9APHY|nr:hypothetical protein EW026_g5646 [Hermanssonia centrifuga]
MHSNPVSASYWRPPLCPQSSSHTSSHIAPQPTAPSLTHQPPYSTWEQSRESWSLPTSYAFDHTDDYATPSSSYEPDYLKIAHLSDSYNDVPDPRLASSASQLSSKPKFEAASWGNNLYRLEPDTESVQDTDPVTQVKQEEMPTIPIVFDTPCLGRDASIHAPKPEVPLRATQASPEMRILMGCFRLNPFATQNGHRGTAATTSWSGEEIGPLREPPRFIDFQLEIPHAASSEPDLPPRRSMPSPTPPFSPPESLQYSYDEEDEEEPSWSSPPAAYSSLHVVPEPPVFEPVMTPAQGLWQMSYQPQGSTDGSSYSLSPPASRE